MDIQLKTPDDIKIMREAGRIVAQAHAEMKKAVKPGVSTWDLNAIADTVIRDHGAIPTFIGVPKSDGPDFPAAITASVNHELVHGIPRKDCILKEGDIVSLDTACTYNGFVGDSAYSYGVGEVSPAVQRLLDVGAATLDAAITASVVPNGIREVAVATQKCAEDAGYSVAREYTGHGVGREMWEPPQIPNWWPRRSNRRLQDANVKLQPGMTYAIEPMVIAGRNRLRELSDKWTVVTKDKSLCVHFEHTILVTENDPVILTLL